MQRKTVLELGIVWELTKALLPYLASFIHLFQFAIAITQRDVGPHIMRLRGSMTLRSRRFSRSATPRGALLKTLGQNK